jgi:hypothetical protein
VKRAGNSTAPHTRVTPSVLEGLAERLEGISPELRELVQEEHTVICERLRMSPEPLYAVGARDTRVTVPAWFTAWFTVTVT